MILARLTRAIREQNWFAVLLEFLIVVAGVLLAFQISQFAAARSQRAYALDTMERVEIQIREVARVRDITRAQLDAHIAGLISARPIVMGREEADALSADQCWAIANSNVINMAPDAVPSIEEVMQSGALAVIDNDALRLATQRFVSKQQAVRRWVRQQHGETSDLTKIFPDMVWFELVEAPEADDGWDRVAVCDLDGMRTSRAFQAHLMRNYVVARATRNLVYDFMDEAFEELHAAADGELGLTHAEEAEDGS
jgi:hypothetical protein